MIHGCSNATGLLFRDGLLGNAPSGRAQRERTLQALTRAALSALVAFLWIDNGVASAENRILEGKDAFGGWAADAPGLRRHFTIDDLPPVQTTPKVPLRTIQPLTASYKPQVPPGFEAELVATDFHMPRVIRTAPNGDLFIAETGWNRVVVLRLPDGSSTPTIREVFAADLFQPYGIAFYPPGPEPKWVYVANSDSVVRFPYSNGDLEARGAPEPIVKRIPWQYHWTRDIAFSPDGERLYLAVGSGSNIGLDMSGEPWTEGGLEVWKESRPLGATWSTEEGRANVLSFTPEGGDRVILATGLRNCSGLTVQPATWEPWCVVNERDGLGDDTPFEFATSLREGEFYGWPWYYLGDHEDPRRKAKRPDLKGKVSLPDVLIQAHSAPLQIVFYEGDSFPPEYKGSAFVTLHGSSNRSDKTGYKVIRLLFDERNEPTGAYEDFMTGMVLSDTEVWARPVGVTVASDGSLFVTEDANGTVWRVSYKGPPAR